MNKSRWLRLNVDWHLSSWLIVLSAESRLAWVQLLCHVKTNGFGGVVKAIPVQAAERLWFVNEPSIRQMLTAAEQAGALEVTDDTWTIVKWAEYQGDGGNADRQRRYRERKSNGSNALRNPTETETETETETSNPLLSPQGETKKKKPKPFGGADIPEDYREAAEAWEAYRKEARLRPWAKTTWERQVAKHSPREFALGVDHSISQGYQGFFLPKENGSVQSLLERARGAS